jgi:hypothetical protein
VLAGSLTSGSFNPGKKSTSEMDLDLAMMALNDKFVQKTMTITVPSPCLFQHTSFVGNPQLSGCTNTLIHYNAVDSVTTNILK